MIDRIINKIGKISPDFIANSIANIPFKYRHGKDYTNFQRLISDANKWSHAEIEKYIIHHFDKIFEHAKENKFYKEKYKKNGVLNLKIKTIEDIRKVPILTKNELRDNLSYFNGYYNAQTGGTTGVPLSIFLDENVWNREWAFFHHIWGTQGYKPDHTKISFRERPFKEFMKYKFDQNEYVVKIVKIYNLSDQDIDEFFDVLIKKNVKYFHGYPSAINDFLKSISDRISDDRKELLKSQIKCCFFSSERPQNHIIDYIRNEWNLDFITWYGHTEACVLAKSDKNKLVYYPFHTYGYVEVEDGKLLGTSYHNFDMPLIRYDSGDIVEEKRYENGIVKSFEIKDGRTFNYLIDKNNLRISMRGTVEYLSKEIYDYVDYIQVYQKEKGKATILITIRKPVNIDLDIISLMKFDEIDIDFNYEIINKPIKTKSGKVALRVHELPSD